jgi:hypothetical protein
MGGYLDQVFHQFMMDHSNPAADIEQIGIPQP